MRKFARRFLIIVSVIVLLLFAALAFWSSDSLLHPDRRALQNYHKDMIAKPGRYGLGIESYTASTGTPCLLVTPSTKPGEARKGRRVREELARNGIPSPAWGEIRGTLVLLHGYRGRKEDNLPIAERFCAAGFRCILPDLPGHGDNPAPLATFGRGEAGLPAQLLSDATRRFSFPAAPAGLFGISQGGAIALQAAALPDHPWSAVASISAFASLDQPVGTAARELYPPLACISPVASQACSVGVFARQGFTPSDIRPVDAAARIRIPAFVAHGDKDTFIPVAAGQAIYNALGDSRKSLHIVKGGRHGDVLAVGGETLYADLCRFFIQAEAPRLSGNGKTSASRVKER